VLIYFLTFSDSYGPENDSNQDGVDVKASACSSVSTGKIFVFLCLFSVILHVKSYIGLCG
jgi:hypothetical protein